MIWTVQAYEQYYVCNLNFCTSPCFDNNNKKSQSNLGRGCVAGATFSVYITMCHPFSPKNLPIPVEGAGSLYPSSCTPLTSLCVRSSMFYGSGTWPVRKENEVALQQAEMRMVRWMCDVKVKDRIPSKWLRERLGLDDIISVLQQN